MNGVEHSLPEIVYVTGDRKGQAVNTQPIVSNSAEDHNNCTTALRHFLKEHTIDYDEAMRSSKKVAEQLHKTIRRGAEVNAHMYLDDVVISELLPQKKPKPTNQMQSKRMKYTHQQHRLL